MPHPLAPALLLALCAPLALGCGGEDSPAAATSTTGAPSGDAGLGCPAGELSLGDGTCLAAGLDPASCGAGFEPDGAMGCNPILPAEPCGEGQMAVPGELGCRDVAPCGAGTFGDIPVEPSTQFVDASYAGGASDGSAAKPWTSIQDGVDAADPGAIVALAAGTYQEDVYVVEPVRLHGRCPAMVELVGSADAPAALVVLADGAEVHGIAVTGDAMGIGVSDCDGVLIDRTWVHDTDSWGVVVVNDDGPASATLRESLVESARGHGVFVRACPVGIEASVVRDTRWETSTAPGRGVNLQDDPDSGDFAEVTLRSSVLERNIEMAVLALGSDVEIDASVLRDTQSLSSSDRGGFGLHVAEREGARRGSAAVRASVLEGNAEAGIEATDSDVTIEATVVRSTRASSYGTLAGRGIDGVRAGLTVTGSLVAANHEIGIAADASSLIVRSTIVRDTQPLPELMMGRGINVQDGDGMRASLVLEGSVVDANREVGVLLSGADATIAATVVRNTMTNDDGLGGRGIGIQENPESGQRSIAQLSGVLIENNSDVGLIVVGSDTTMTGSTVRATLARSADGLFGDGVTSAIAITPSMLRIEASRVEASARGGISSFGSAIELGATKLDCNGLDLDGEESRGQPYSFVDLGGNACGCGSDSAGCLVQSVALEPPAPLDL